jgi:hypothetical protein
MRREKGRGAETHHSGWRKVCADQANQTANPAMVYITRVKVKVHTEIRCTTRCTGILFMSYDIKRLLLHSTNHDEVEMSA